MNELNEPSFAGNNPLVTVVVLNWNGGAEIIGCIEHIKAQTYDSIEIIVIDNGSTDKSSDVISRRFADITLVKNDRNIGYSSGMNQGIALARGEYVLLPGQDAWIDTTFIQNAVQLMVNSKHNIGMIGSRVNRLRDGQKTDEPLGGGMLLRKFFRLAGDPDFSTQHYNLGPSFCCPFLSMKMLSEVKACSGHYFDDRYFAYGEDMDLMIRSQLLGWRSLFSPKLIVWHSQSGSLKGKVRLVDKPPVFRKYSLRNRYLTLIKDAPFRLILLLAPYIVLTEIAMWPYFLFKSPRTLLCLIAAYIETIHDLPETLQLRRRIQTSRKVSIKYLRQLFLTGF